MCSSYEVVKQVTRLLGPRVLSRADDHHDIGGDSGLRLGNDVRVILLSLLPDGGVNVGFVDSVA